MTTAGKNRIMISPKSDGTYVIEFTTAAAEFAGDPNPGDRGGSDPAFSGAHALRAVRAGDGRGQRLYQLMPQIAQG
jgi:hypothetical protein